MWKVEVGYWIILFCSVSLLVSKAGEFLLFLVSLEFFVMKLIIVFFLSSSVFDFSSILSFFVILAMESSVGLSILVLSVFGGSLSLSNSNLLSKCEGF